jgi:hypothetical protein
MMQPRWFIWTITLVLLPWSVFAAEVPSSPGSLDTVKLEGLLKTIMPSFAGQSGRWEGVFAESSRGLQPQGHPPAPEPR